MKITEFNTAKSWPRTLSIEFFNFDDQDMKQSYKFNNGTTINGEAVHNTADSSEKKKMTKSTKIIYTLIHNYFHLLFGLTLSSMACAFIDYKIILGTSMEMIGLFPMFQAIGIFCGSFMTVTYKYLNRQVVLSILVILQGFGTIFQPWTTSLWQLYLCIFVYGFGVGAWNGANNVILIEIWQNKSPSMLQFSQFVYGVGTILGPLLAEFFVLGEELCPGVMKEDIEYCFNSNVTIPVPSINCDDCLHYDRRPRIKIPMLIGGLLQIFGPVMYLTMFVFRRYEFTNDSKVEVVTTPEQKARHKKYVPVKTILVCVSLYFAFGVMSENMYMDFAPTFYQYCAAKLTAAEASQMFSEIAIALSVGRGISIFIAMYLKPWHMIAYQSVIVFAGYIFQYFGQHDKTLLLISSLVICFGYSSIFICLFSFVGQYMQMTDKIGGLFIGAYNSVYMFLPYFIGKYIELNPQSFVFVELASFSIGITAFIVVMFAVWKVPDDLIRKLGPIGGH